VKPATFERFVAVLRGAFELGDVEMERSTRLVDDLGFDSFDFLRLSLIAEEIADTYIPDLSLVSVPDTLDDAYVHYCSLVLSAVSS